MLNSVNDMEKIKVYGTKSGKLYIKPEDLFSLPKVQEQIKRASKIVIPKPIPQLT